MDCKYKKGGDAGSKGVQFQVNLLTLFLLKAITKLKNWKLSTENNVAGKFDDVVLEYPDEAVLLQSKHKDNKMTITFEDLLSTNSKKDDFSLPKYFLSYQEIKNRFKAKNVIVCTNANFDKKTSTFMKSTKVSPDSMLYYEIDNCLVYTFNDNILPDLKNNTKIYLKECRNKKIEESVINDENLKDFLDHLHFHFNYPSGRDIESIIERQLSTMRDISNFYDKATLTDIHSKMMDWFQQKDGEYLTEVRANAMFSEIKRDKYWQKLEKYDVFFQHNNLKFDSPTKIFHIVDDEGSLLREIQVYRALQSTKTVLSVSPESDVNELKEILKVFELPKYTLLTIVWSKFLEKFLVLEITTKLEQILTHKDYKKVILVTKNNSDLITQFQLRNLSHQVIHHSIIFDDLSEETQKNVLRKRIINFQGNTFNLKELLPLETTKDYEEAMNCEILEKLIKNEEIIVGHKVLPLDLDIEHLYINRTLVRNDEQIEEENVFEINEKVILIADGPGMGKSTILTNLAVAIKKKYLHLWIIKIVLSDYTRILNTALRENKKALNPLELLNSQVETRLTHQLEKHIFSMNKRIVLMLDGVDEISPKYTQLVENLIVNCQQAQNFAKIIVTSRPHMTEQLENKLKVQSFKLQPFTKRNQVDFLSNYWTRNLNLDHTNRAKCEEYAESLLNQMWFSRNENYMETSHFASIPLQVKMLAEIFQERNRLEGSSNWDGFKEYLETNEAVPNLPKINFANLFRMFIDKKRNVYLDKSNPSGNAMADISINKRFDDCIKYHRVRALEVILNKQKCELFTNYKQSSNSIDDEVFNIGIIQKTGNNIHFIHRTFAEYFVAECLVRELQSQNRNVEFQKFLIDEVLKKYDYSIICAFFDNFLEEVLHSLPCNIFKEYQYSTDNLNENLFLLIHHIAEEGYVSIFQLILKGINFTVMKPVSFKEFAHFRTREMFSIFDQIDFNNRYGNGQTLLDRAVDGGHLDMVKFLCSKIYSNLSHNVDLPLNKIVYFDIENFLVTNIEPNTILDYRILYIAIFKDYPSIAEYFLEKILEADESATTNPLVPYTVAYLGKLDILESLLRENKTTVNDKIPNGETLIFGAARRGQLEIIKYLVDHGADVNSKDDKGNTALHIICKNSSLNSTAKLLIELGIDINAVNFDKKETALNMAAASGNFDAVQLLIDNDADVNTKDLLYGANALHYAVRHGHLKIVKLLIQKGALIDINVRSKLNMLDIAVTYGYLDIIKWLLKATNASEVDLKGRSGYRALRIAIKNYKFDVVSFFLEYGVNVKIKYYDEYPVLHTAVQTYQLSTVELLIKYGVNINITDEEENTALHVAARLYINTDMFKLLVNSGIDVNIRNQVGHTALHIIMDSYAYACLPLVKELDVEKYEKGLEAMSEDDMMERWSTNPKVLKEGEKYLQFVATCLCSIIFLIKSDTDINLVDSSGKSVASIILKKDDGRFLIKYLGLKLT